MVNYIPYLIYDFETDSPFPHSCHPIQLAALVVNPRTLEYVKDNLGKPVYFNSMIRIPDKELDEIQADPKKKAQFDKALDINKKTIDEIQNGPEEKQVWANFVAFTQRYARKPKNAWDSVIPVGYNSDGFDRIIIERLAQKYGTTDAEGQQYVFHKMYSVDVIKLIFQWHESNTELTSYKLDNVRDHMGLSKEKAHDALQDVYDTARIFRRIQKRFRSIAEKVTFKDSFKVRPLEEDE